MKEAILREISYVPATDSDLDGISQLINGMRNLGNKEQNQRNMSKEYYRWMYFHNPTGNAFVYVAKHKGKIISSFAIAPKRMTIDGNVMIVGKIMDMFTHPYYQGLGINNELVKLAFRAAGNAGINIFYVAPSVHSYPIFKKKWGFVDSFILIYRIRIFDAKSVLDTFNKFSVISSTLGLLLNWFIKKIFKKRNFSLPQGYRIKLENYFDVETEELWNKSKAFKVAIVRNSEYMNWRYIKNPDQYEVYKLYFGEKICALVVIKYIKRRGLKVGEIVDFLFSPSDFKSIKILLSYILSVFYKKKCVLGEVWSIKNTFIDRIILKAGYRMNRARVNFLLSPNSPNISIYKKDSWLLTQGDGNDI